MGADHHGHVGLLKECVQVVCSEQRDVVLFLRITDEIVLEAVFLFVLVRIRPKKVNNSLVRFILILSKFYLESPLDYLDGINILNCWSNTAMATEDLPLLLGDDGSKWHVLESLVNFGKN